jgi:hypothetical protein
MSELIQEIERCLEATGMAASTFGRKSINDGKLVPRLKNGGRVWPETEQRIRDFIKTIQ